MHKNITIRQLNKSHLDDYVIINGLFGKDIPLRALCLLALST